jgi:EmrB/QacA subfamily drug resistance transporter
MSTLDASIVNIALPIIRAQFKASMSMAEWVIMAYVLTIIVLLMIFGRAADIYGQKKVFMLGITIFTFSSLLCGLSQSIHQLVIFRMVQGIGAACVTANSNAIVTYAFPTHERGMALGWIGTIVSIGLSVGPVLGGLITSLFGWRYIFLFNLPLGIITILLANSYLDNSQRAQNEHFDFFGAITLTVSLIALMLALTKYHLWGATATILLIVFSGLVFLAFIKIENIIPDPMIDLRLFRNRTFSYANLSAFLNFAGRFSIVFLMPFYLVDFRKMDTAAAGLLMTPIPILFAVIAPISGSLSDRIGTRLLTTSGMMITALGFLIFSFIDESTTIAFLLLPLILIGLGGGIFSSPNVSAIMGSVTRDRLGNAGAMVALVRNVGSLVGVAWSGALFNALSGHNTNFENSIANILPAFQTSMKVAVVISLLSAFTAYKREK